MAINKEHPKWGGSRESSGRKATGRLKQFQSTSVTGTPEEIAQLKELAKAENKSVSRYVLDTLLHLN